MAGEGGGVGVMGRCRDEDGGAGGGRWEAAVIEIVGGME